MCACLACVFFATVFGCTFVKRSGVFGSGSIYCEQTGFIAETVRYDIRVESSKVSIIANYSLKNIFQGNATALVAVPFFTDRFNPDSFRASVDGLDVPVSYGYREGYDSKMPYDVLKPSDEVLVSGTSDNTVQMFRLVPTGADATVTFKHTDKRKLLFVDAPGFLEGKTCFDIGQGLVYYAQAKYGEVTLSECTSVQEGNTSVREVIKLFSNRYLAAVGDVGSEFINDFYNIVMAQYVKVSGEKDFHGFLGMIKTKYDNIFIGDAELEHLDSVYIARFAVSGGENATLTTTYSSIMNVDSVGSAISLYLPPDKFLTDSARVEFNIISDVDLTISAKTGKSQDGLNYIYNSDMIEPPEVLKISYEPVLSDSGAVETAFMSFLVTALILTVGVALAVLIYQLSKKIRPPAPPHKFDSKIKK